MQIGFRSSAAGGFVRPQWVALLSLSRRVLSCGIDLNVVAHVPPLERKKGAWFTFY